MKARVFWTTRENELVLHEVARLIGLDGHPTVSIVSTAQDNVLPTDRRKSLSGLNGMLFKKTAHSFKSNLKTFFKTLKHTKPEPLPSPGVPVKMVDLQPTTQEQPEQPEQHMTIDHMIDQLSEAFRLRLRSALQRVTREELERVTGEETFNIASSMLKETKKLHRVLVVGTKGNQQDILRSEFDGVLNLTFSEGDNPSRAAKSAENVNAVVIWGNFISHSTIHSIEKVAKDRIVTVKGGMNAISDALMKLAVA